MALHRFSEKLDYLQHLW